MLDLFISTCQHSGMKFKKRPFKKPTWASDNSPKVHKKWGLSTAASLERTKRNNKIAKILKLHGWKFSEGWNMTNGFESYYSLSFRRPVDGIEIPTKGIKYTAAIHPWVHFTYRWDNQGGDDFMVGEMYSFYSYARQKPYMRPTAQFEIRHITEKHLGLLTNMYHGVLAAIKSQVTSYGDAENID